jgi:putative MATE family efflux protein
MSADPAPSVPPASSFWRSVAQALRGHHLDYTAEALPRAVLLLAVPMVLEMVMESLFAVADVFWVSRLGRGAVAVVGLNESIMTLIYALAIGISIAGAAMVARRIGEKNPDEAAHAAAQLLVLGLGIALLLGAVLGSLAPRLLALMGAEPDIVTQGTAFSRVMLGGNATVFLIFLINAVFRGAGDAVIAMRTLWLANGLNILLGPCFIFGWGPFPELGLTGAAVATNLGRGCGVLYQVWHLLGHHSRIKVRPAHFVPDAAMLRTILRTSGSGIAQMLIAMTSWIGLYKILAVSGSAALAGYTIAIRVIIFALMPAWGLSNAGATLVGQNLGAGRPDRAEEAVRLAAKYNMLFLGAVGLIFVALAGPIAGLFQPDPEVFTHAKRALWVISLAFPLYAAGMCYGGAFNGAGDTWTPTRLNFFCFWLCELPLAWVLAVPAGLGPTGVFIAIPASFSIFALWSMALFRKGAWKTKKI